LLQRESASTLLPYTTLFRSGISAISVLEDGVLLSENITGLDFLGSISVIIEDNIAKITVVASGTSFNAEDVIVDTTNFNGILSADRKSTRLNSSHVKISYAV